MTMIFKSIPVLPGLFNECVCELFSEGEKMLVINPDKSDNKKEMIFKSAVTVYGGKDVFDKMKSVPSVTVDGHGEYDLEILSVHRPTASEHRVQQAYIHMHGTDYDIKMGYITVKHCILPTLHYFGEPKRVPAKGIDRIILDDDILQHLKPGFFLHAKLAELNIGLKFMEDYPSVFPTFQTVLPQCLMRRYKRGPSRKPVRTVESVSKEDV